jgi:broad specificity phosphatase PhoE
MTLLNYPETLILVRHGQSESNMVHKKLVARPENFHLRHDTHMRLSPTGVEQAKVTGEWLKANINPNFEHKYVSPLVRTAETAATLNLGDGWILEDLLREREWGEHGTYSDEDQKKLFKASTMLKKQFAWSWKPTGGESLSTGVRLRVERTLDTLAKLQGTKDAILVTHGEFISVTRYVLEHLTPYEWVEKDVDKKYSIHNTMVYEYTRVNPQNSEDIRDNYKWRRATCVWDETKSHDNGEWVELHHTRFSQANLMELVNKFPRILSE